MRTNVDIDSQLLNKALKVSKQQTKRQAIILALKEYIRNHSRLDIRELKGNVAFRKDYNHKTLR